MTETEASSAADRGKPSIPVSASPRTEVDLVQVFRILAKARGKILALAATCAVITAITVTIMKPYYRAEATFLPPNSMASSPSAMMGSMASFGASSGLLGGLRDPSQQYVGLLKSRSVADQIIKKFDLKTVYKSQLLSQAESSLAANTDIVAGKDSIVALHFDDRDPVRAAAIANAYLDALSNLSDRVAVTEASQRRQYFEKQLAKEKDALADAEVELAHTQEEHGLIQPENQARLQITTIAQLQAQVASLQVELTSLGQGATDQNPEVIRLRSQIDKLKSQIASLEKTKQGVRVDGLQAPVSEIPQLTLIYIRKARDAKYHQALYDLLLRQYEAARLEESRSAPSIQVIDFATPPDKKYGPRRTLWTLAAALVGGLLGIAWVLLGEMKANYARSLEQV